MRLAYLRGSAQGHSFPCVSRTPPQRSRTMKVHFTDTPCNTNRTRRTTHNQRVTNEVAKVTCAVCRKRKGLDNPEWVAKLIASGHAK
jgi:hypothetical protein